MSDSIQEDIEYWLGYQNELKEDKKFWCRMPDCTNKNEFLGSVEYFDSFIKIFNNDEINSNTSQLSIFDFTEEDRKNLDHIQQTEKGACETCHTIHIACPDCGKLICDPENWGEFYCADCETNFEMVNHPILKHEVLSRTKTVFLFSSAPADLQP